MCLIGEDSNGEAIEQFRSHRPEVTLIDSLMSEMNGIERSRGSVIPNRNGALLASFCSVENYGAGGDGSAVCTQAARIRLYVLFPVVRVKL